MIFRSYRLFTIWGIPVYVHGTLILFLLIAGLVFSQGTGFAGFVLTVALLACAFAFVLLHELGHCALALYHRVPVRKVTLYPIGGIASLGAMPRSPRVEFQVAIAGPLVNFVLAAGFALIHFLAPGEFLAALIRINLLLGLLNLLPGFPLDGGRILRALLARKMPYLDATRIAARIGQAVAVALGIAGLVMLNFLLVAIAVFIYFAAQAELFAVMLSSPENIAQEILRRLRDWEVPAYGPGRPHPFAGFDGGFEEPGRPEGEGEEEECVIEMGPDGRIRRIWRRTR